MGVKITFAELHKKQQNNHNHHLTSFCLLTHSTSFFNIYLKSCLHTCPIGIGALQAFSLGKNVQSDANSYLAFKFCGRYC